MRDTAPPPGGNASGSSPASSGPAASAAAPGAQPAGVKPPNPTPGVTTVRSKALRIGFTDYQEEDDDRITVTLDNEERHAQDKPPLTLLVNAHLFNSPPAGKIMNAVPGDLRFTPGVNAYLSYGVNTITIRCNSAGIRGPCTLRITLAKQDILDGQNRIWFWDMMPGETRQFTLGFSQVHFDTRWPENADHAHIAQGIINPSTGRHYARLVTIEQNKAAAKDRRDRSTTNGYVKRNFANLDGSSYGPTIGDQQYDEYRIVLVPGEGHVERYGVVQGAPTIADVRRMARA